MLASRWPEQWGTQVLGAAEGDVLYEPRSPRPLCSPGRQGMGTPPASAPIAGARENLSNTVERTAFLTLLRTQVWAETKTEAVSLQLWPFPAQ